MKGMDLLIRESLKQIEQKVNLVEVPCEKYCKMRVNGIMKFRVKQYDIENLGNLSTMSLNLGLMKMMTFVVTPIKKDMPLISADYMYIMGKRKAYLEIYDLAINRSQAYKDLLAKYSEIRDEYEQLEDLEPTEAWYRDLIATSFYKTGKKVDDAKLNDLLFRILNIYLDDMEKFPILDKKNREEKAKEIQKYSNGLIDKGGISTDVFKKSLGEEATKEFFDETFFGTSKIA